MAEVSKLLLDMKAAECLSASLQSVSSFAETVKSLSTEALSTGPLRDPQILRQFIELGQIARFGAIRGLAITTFYTALVEADELASSNAKKTQSDLIAIESNIEAILYEASYALQEKLPLLEPSLKTIRNAASGSIDRLNHILRRSSESISRHQQP